MKYLFVLLLFLLVGCSSQEAKEKLSMPDHERRHRYFAEMIMDSAYVGIKAFHEAKGRYPYSQGKYFVDSIKSYVGDLTPYVYSDRWNTVGKQQPVFYYEKTDSCYLGNNRYDSPIIYHYLNDNQFLMYWVGENGVDDMGKGDDVVYRKDN